MSSYMKTATERFIEKAVEGGFVGGHPLPNDTEYWPEHIHEVLLMPEVWKAVGKVEGWEEGAYLCPGCETIGVGKGNHMRACPIKDRKHGSPIGNMHRMIDALVEGKTIEEYLATIV